MIVYHYILYANIFHVACLFFYLSYDCDTSRSVDNNKTFTIFLRHLIVSWKKIIKLKTSFFYVLGGREWKNRSSTWFKISLNLFNLLNSTKFNHVTSVIHLQGFGGTCFKSRDAPPAEWDGLIILTLTCVYQLHRQTWLNLHHSRKVNSTPSPTPNTLPKMLLQCLKVLPLS